MNTGKFFNGN